MNTEFIKWQNWEAEGLNVRCDLCTDIAALRKIGGAR